MMIDEKIEIKKVIDSFQSGYSKRNVSIINDYFGDIFSKNNVIIIGTSNDEWCLDINSSKEMVKSDWEWWGDVLIDTENSRISCVDDNAWFSTNGTVKYTFEDNDNKYDRYLAFVEKNLTDNEDNKNLSLKSRLALVNWVLTHALQDRKEEKREYLWTFRLSGFLVKEEYKWKIKNLHFSMPATSLYADVRFNSQNEYAIYYESLKNILQKFNIDGFSEEQSSVLNSLISLQKYISEEGIKDSHDPMKDLFINQEDIRIVGTDNNWHEGICEVSEYINYLNSHLNSFILHADDSVVSVGNKVAWIACNGVMLQETSEDAIIEKQTESLSHIIKESSASKDKLFKIHRDISAMFKELSVGHNFLWPFRFEAVMMKENNKWLFHTIHLSYPFYYILEGKADVSKRNI